MRENVMGQIQKGNMLPLNPFFWQKVNCKATETSQMEATPRKPEIQSNYWEEKKKQCGK